MRMIAAVDENWGIGKDGKLLVSIPEDLARFRKITMGHTVVCGRKTLESFPGGKPLKNRENIVMTRNELYTIKGAKAVHSIPELLSLCAEIPGEEIFVIGGGTLYRSLLPYTDICEITRIDRRFEADTTFPNLDASGEWEIAERGEKQVYGDLTYRFLTYRRVFQPGA